MSRLFLSALKGEDFLEKSVGQKGAPGSPPPHHFEVPRIFGVLERWSKCFLGGRECWSKWKQVVWYTFILYVSIYIYMYIYIYIMYIRVYRVYNFICLFNRYVRFLVSNTSSSYIFIFYIYSYLHSYTHILFRYTYLHNYRHWFYYFVVFVSLLIFVQFLLFFACMCV